jgi:heptosyltransferase III
VRILFIKLKHIGDALLMTPTLASVRERYPDAEIWVVVRRGCEGVLAGCPAIDRLLTAPAPERGKRARGDLSKSFNLVWEIRRKRFDHVFELSDGERGRWISAFTRTRHRCTNGGVLPLSRFWRLFFDQIASSNWLGLHTVEKDYRTVAEFLSLPREIPRMTFDPGGKEPWEPAAALDEFAFLHPATRWQRKRWPEGKWIELGKALLDRLPRLIVSCGPDAEEIESTRLLCERLGERALFTGGNLSWGQVAWLLDRARLFVGVDTAAMHLAAACQCPTAAIFGPSVPWCWRPWRVPSRILAPEAHEVYSCRQDEFAEVAELKTADVTVEQVIAACDGLLSTGRGGQAESVEVPRETKGAANQL